MSLNTFHTCFLQVFHRLKNQSDAVGEAIGTDQIDREKQKALSEVIRNASAENQASSNNHPDECVICLERTPELILPCAHSYCLPCIEQWNVDHKTCPVCRETLSSTDDGWVVSDRPDGMEIATEIQKALLSLTQ